MAIVKMSNTAYEEFSKFLEQNNVTSKILRIFLAGNGWGGPIFNLALDEQKLEDVVEKIEDITFLVEGNLYKEFGGFSILCAEENGSGGFSIDPVNKPEGGGCASCSSCG